MAQGPVRRGGQEWRWGAGRQGSPPNDAETQCGRVQEGYQTEVQGMFKTSISCVSESYPELSTAPCGGQAKSG